MCRSLLGCLTKVVIRTASLAFLVLVLSGEVLVAVSAAAFVVFAVLA